MKWKTSAKLKPFSHNPGTQWVIPYSYLKAKCFPTRVEITTITDDLTEVLDFAFPEIVDTYTSQLDLEKKRLVLWGSIHDKVFRFIIQVQDNSLVLHVKRVPENGASVKIGETVHNLTPNSTIEILQNVESFCSDHDETLFLGCSKKQEVASIITRSSPHEILPFIYKLGQLFPETTIKKLSHPLERALKNPHKAEALLEFKRVLKSTFSNFLVPISHDEMHYGLHKDEIANSEQRKDLLRVLYDAIKQSFVVQQAQEISLLPSLPKGIESGFLSDVKVDGLHIDLVISKKALLRVRFRATKPGSYTIYFPKGIGSCRLREHIRQKGIDFFSGGTVSFSSSKVLILDRFQKA